MGEFADIVAKQQDRAIRKRRVKKAAVEAKARISRVGHRVGGYVVGKIKAQHQKGLEEKRAYEKAYREEKLRQIRIRGKRAAGSSHSSKGQVFTERGMSFILGTPVRKATTRKKRKKRKATKRTKPYIVYTN